MKFYLIIILFLTPIIQYITLCNLIIISNHFIDDERTNKIDNIMSFKEKYTNSSIISNWLKISSPAFKNSILFPQVTLPNNKKASIKIDESYFRINHTFSSKKKNNKSNEIDDKYFWFRLNVRHIYYSSSENDINILGSIHIKSINRLNESNEYLCFYIKDISSPKQAKS